MKKRSLIPGIVALIALFVFSLPVAAAGTTVIVTPPVGSHGWSTADTRPGGAVLFVADSSAPLGTGALQLTTDATTAAKAQYMHDAANTPLASITELSYYTKQVSGPLTADASYQLVVDLNGAAEGGFTTLVYEPYWNGIVVPGSWQQWDVAAGRFWSSKTFTDGTCAILAGAGGPPLYTLEQLQTACPDAIVTAFGVNIGSYNPNYNVETDGVDFNGTTYDFELTNMPTSKDQCKDEGYQNLTDAQGQPFTNQGQCVSFTNHN